MLSNILNKLSVSAEYTIDEIMTILEKISESMSAEEAAQYIEELKNEVDNLDLQLKIDGYVEGFTNLPSKGKTLMLTAGILGVVGFACAFLMSKSVKETKPYRSRKMIANANKLAAATLTKR